MYARLYNVAWYRTGRDRPVMTMSAIRTALDSANAYTSAARTDFRYIKRGSIKLPGLPSTQDYQANYLIYSNDDVHYFGAWVDSIEWLSSAGMTVNYTDDLFTTFAKGSTITGYRTRRVTDQTTGEAVGDFRACETTVDYLWGLQLDSTNNPILVYLNVEASATAFYKPRGIVETPLLPVLLESATDKSEFIRLIQDTNFNIDKVVAAYILPAAMTADVTTASITFTIVGASNVTLHYITDSALKTVTVNPFSAITGDNRLFLNSNDAKLTVRLGKSSINIPIETIDTSSNFTITMALTPFPAVSITPPWKSNVTQTHATSYGYNDFPTISLQNSAYNLIALKSTIPAIGKAITGFATGGVPGAAAGLGAGIGDMLGAYLSDPAPDTTTGSVNSIDATHNTSVAIQLTLPADKTRGIAYYKQFGYPCAHRETMDLSPWTSTAAYDFYQSTDNVITGTMPAAAKDEIDAMLKSGVRCWNTINVGVYT